MNIAVCVSGGVDSLCALLKLREAGHTVLALHARFVSTDDSASKLARLLAKLNVPFLALDCQKQFTDQILNTSLDTWYSGATPNPCALCNRDLKFGLLLDIARRNGCEALATEHYAQTIRVGDHLLLAPAFDADKDQSYFLSLIASSALPSLLFPLAKLDKKDCRAYVAAFGLEPPESKESQDICFLPSEHCLREASLLKAWEKRHQPPPAHGAIVIVDGKNSIVFSEQHKGLWRYTEGQRKGLGISYREGLYVLKKETADNTLVLGPRNLLGMRSLSADHVNLFFPPEAWPKTLLVQVRSRQKWCEACVRLEGGALEITFPEMQFPTAKGQLVTVRNQQGYILAGGLVSRVSMCVDEG